MSDENEDCNCDQALALIETVKQLRAELETEKRRIVAWIRDQPYQHAQGLADIADAIASGEHRKEGDNE